MSSQILIIDDDVGFKRILEMRLKSFIPDASITHFASLSDARRFLKSAQDTRSESSDFDLIIVDQHLPDGHGSDFVAEGWFRDRAVLSVSSDDAPEIPGATVQAGAMFFLNKRNVSEPLFRPLVLGLIDRNRMLLALERSRLNEAVVESVRTLVSTLRHEINNPLGAVLGAAYLLRTAPNSSEEQKEAASLVESSGQRIKHVLDQLCTAVELDSVEKSSQRVFHIPGDKPWGEK